MHRKQRGLLVRGSVADSEITTEAQPVTGGTFPIAKSSNSRFLQTAGGTPFFMVSDSPQSLTVNLAPTDNVTSTDAGHYLVTRASQGFNTIWVNIICVVYTGGRSDGSTFDGLLPFNSKVDATHYDLTDPNTAYWARMDAHIQLATSHGFCVVIDPIETGGWTDTALANGTTRCRTYGRFLGSRYASFPNVCWLHGNDYQQSDWATYDPVLTQVSLGIRDNMPSALQTIEVEQNRTVADDGSLANATWAPLIDIDSAYLFTDKIIYGQMYTEYNRTGFLPVVMVEASYENENTPAGPIEIRQQAWWTLTAGGTGYFYGEAHNYAFQTGWQNFLTAPNSPGADQLRHLVNFTAAHNWQDLVPDQAHTFITGGRGTSGTTSFATAAKTADGHLGVVYVPFVTNVVLNLALMAGATTATWIDPANGSTSSAGSSLSGSHTFTHPGNNSAGSPDWVLLLSA